MQALVAYIKFLSTGVPPGRSCPASAPARCRSSIAPPIPRAARRSTPRACAACHNTDGSGIRRSLPTTDLGYMVPPLWGADSFNDGAGMARLITAANFIHFNMPHGADYLNPQLSPEQAWDVAAYMISQPRPHKAGLDKDFPDLLEKPVDAPYGPYADGFARAAAQIRSVRADPRRGRAAQGGEGRERALVVTLTFVSTCPPSFRGAASTSALADVDAASPEFITTGHAVDCCSWGYGFLGTTIHSRD